MWLQSGGGCATTWPKPSFQTDAGCAGRLTNDVAAVGSGLSVYDTTRAIGIESTRHWLTVGGTSASTPIIAAVEALSEPAARELGPEAFYRFTGSLFDVFLAKERERSVPHLLPLHRRRRLRRADRQRHARRAALRERTGPAGRADSSLVGAPAKGYAAPSSPAGIGCPGSCASAFDAHSTVTLTATAAAGSTFAGWQGACGGTGGCVVTPASGSAVTATFRAGEPPAGWNVSPLEAPSGRSPGASALNLESSFYGVSLSADGSERATAVFEPPVGFCTYASTEQHRRRVPRPLDGFRWAPDGTITAPALGEGLLRPLGELQRLRQRGQALGRWRIAARHAPGDSDGPRIRGPGRTLCRVRLSPREPRVAVGQRHLPAAGRTRRRQRERSVPKLRNRSGRSPTTAVAPRC